MRIIVLIFSVALSMFMLSAKSETAPFAEQIPLMMTVPNAVDSNQDQQLSTEEILAAPQQLIKLDKNGDGSLDQREIGAYLDKLPLIRHHFIVNLIDANGDVKISAEEIENASSALRVLDRDGDWQVSKSELTLARPIKAPTFSMRRMPKEVWDMSRSYSQTLEGPLPPGKDNRAFNGYMLIHDAGDFNQIQVANKTYLLNEQGEQVHEWQHPGYSPEASVSYLLPNGQLLRTLSYHHWVEDKNFPVGAHSSIQLVAWDGEIVWEYSMSVAEKYSFHHDVEYMPNGNILAIRYTAFTKEEAMALGWDPSLGHKAAKRITNRMHLAGQELVWLDSVLELQPNLQDGSTEIVWQWNSWDHLVQNKYPHKSNYGDISDPAKIHVNYLNLDKDIPFNGGQFHHINSVDYNPELDVIMLSSPTYGEVWFVDHSTTMEQAASGKGGQYNQGGDLLFRWGNDEAFGKGSRDDSFLFWQHDASWISPGLPGEGNILIYNNGSRRTLDDKYMKNAPANIYAGGYSNLIELKIPLSSNGRLNKKKKPKIVWTWESPNRQDYFSPFMSGLQRLPNGNTIFCRAYDKHIIEVTPNGEKALDFSLAGWGRLHRVYKYEPQYSGLKFLK